jgi:hypothetical protein
MGFSDKLITHVSIGIRRKGPLKFENNLAGTFGAFGVNLYVHMCKWW